MKSPAAATEIQAPEEGTGGAFADEARNAFREWILDADFPCTGAKAAFTSDAHTVNVYGELATPEATAALARDLGAFAKRDAASANEFATFVGIFMGPRDVTEEEFEQRLWRQLRMLTELDRSGWDPEVAADPGDPHFSFSFAGRALYVIGMHANSARIARRFPWPALVFNPHDQFQRLRRDGKWARMQQTIRDRDVRLQGSANPMLRDFGEQSEARQYSGRVVDENWQPPCPFGHGK